MLLTLEPGRLGITSVIQSTASLACAVRSPVEAVLVGHQVQRLGQVGIRQRQPVGWMAAVGLRRVWPDLRTRTRPDMYC